MPDISVNTDKTEGSPSSPPPNYGATSSGKGAVPPYPSQREPPPDYDRDDPVFQPHPRPVTYTWLPWGRVVAPNTVIVVERRPNVVLVNPELPCDSTAMTCPRCRNSVFSTVVRVPSTKTHLWALILCLLGCWPCFFVPYCLDSCQRSHHYCPTCGNYLGTAIED